MVVYPPGLGMKSFVSMKEQTDFGTADTTSMRHFKVLGETLAKVQKPIAVAHTWGRSPQDPFQGHVDVKGDVTLAAKYCGLEQWYEHLFGVRTTVDDSPEAGMSTHTFTRSDVIEEGLTVKCNRGLWGYVYDTLIPSACAWTQSPEAALQAVISLLGRDCVTADLEAHGNTWKQSGGLVLYNQFALTLDDTTTIDLTEASITFGVNPDEGGYRLGAQTRQRHAGGDKGKVEISIKREFDLKSSIFKTLRDAWMGLTACKLAFKWTGAIPAGKVNARSWEIVIPVAYLGGDDPPVSNPGPIPVTFTAEGYYDSGTPANENIYAVLINEIADADV